MTRIKRAQLKSASLAFLVQITSLHNSELVFRNPNICYSLFCPFLQGLVHMEFHNQAYPPGIIPGVEPNLGIFSAVTLVASTDEGRSWQHQPSVENAAHLGTCVFAHNCRVRVDRESCVFINRSFLFIRPCIFVFYMAKRIVLMLTAAHGPRVVERNCCDINIIHRRWY